MAGETRPRQRSNSWWMNLQPNPRYNPGDLSNFWLSPDPTSPDLSGNFWMLDKDKTNEQANKRKSAEIETKLEKKDPSKGRTK